MLSSGSEETGFAKTMRFACAVLCLATWWVSFHVSVAGWELSACLFHFISDLPGLGLTFFLQPQVF